MATLKCNSCGGNLSSGARRVQCSHCGEMFPFRCARCDHKLRPPFSIFDDERYLTHDTPPQPLCEEHYLRQCPDCNNWFGADENPGFFRCRGCAQTHEQTRESVQAPQFAAVESASIAPPDDGVSIAGTHAMNAGAQPKGAGGNVLVIGLAVCAFLALVGWMIFGR